MMAGATDHRVAYQSLADATPLLLLIFSVGDHLAMTGLGLLFFGARGIRKPSFWDLRLSLGALTLSDQAIIIATSDAPIVLLWLFFRMLALRQGAARHGGKPAGRAPDGNFVAVGRAI